MNRKYHYIDELYASFKESMLPALSKGDSSAFDCLEKAHIQTNGRTLPLEFNLGNLFTAILIWGKEREISLPSTSNFDAEFKYFWSLLTNPWPISELKKSGLSIRPRKTTGAKVGHTYELSNT